jgi:hypothetical protein
MELIMLGSLLEWLVIPEHSLIGRIKGWFDWFANEKREKQFREEFEKRSKERDERYEKRY